MRLVLMSGSEILIKGFQELMDGCTDFEFSGVLRKTESTAWPDVHAPTDLLLVDFAAERDFGMVLDILEKVPGLPVLLWVTDIHPEIACQMMKAGIGGILRSSLRANAVVSAVREVAAGKCYFESEFRDLFFESRNDLLSPRQAQLVILVSQGLKNKEISEILSISDSTVRGYLSTLFRKLSVKDRYELAIYGLRHLLGQQVGPGESVDAATPVGIPLSTPVRFMPKPAASAAPAAPKRATPMVVYRRG